MMQDPSLGNPALGKDDAMSWRLYFLLGALMIGFAFAHIVALQKLNAMQGESPAAMDPPSD
jgi:hypothetical protein